MEILSPVKGKVGTLKSLKDGVFSEEMMGPGFIIKPKEDMICAPITGKLVTVFPTGHAYGIKGKDGTNVLVHIGIDTVGLKGEGFTPLVKQGKKIKAGEPMVEVDFKKIKSKVPSIDVITLVTTDSTTTLNSISVKGDVEKGDIIALSS